MSVPDDCSAVRTSGSSLFPVTYSILTTDAVRAQVAQAYPIDMPITCQLLRRGLHDTYLLTTRGSRYIARVYRARRRTPSDIAYELELLTYLAARGVSVSVPVRARDGELSHLLSAPEGTRHLVLFTYAAGTRLSWREEEPCYRAGKLLAAIHEASEDFESRYERFRLDLEYLIGAPVAALHPFLAHRPDDWSYVQGLGDRLRARAEAAIRMGLEWGVCHGDYGAKNIHITEDQILTVFDFDRCGPGWRAYDFALIQWGAMGLNKNHMWDAFVKGYTDTRRLIAEELAAVPLFHALCHLSNLGIFAGNVHDWGLLRMSDWLLDRELTFFRQWEVDHLEGK
jgi:Ser/Thr protein kinase RdoA (MazF antagonist)